MNDTVTSKKKMLRNFSKALMNLTAQKKIKKTLDAVTKLESIMGGETKVNQTLTLAKSGYYDLLEQENEELKDTIQDLQDKFDNLYHDLSIITGSKESTFFRRNPAIDKTIMYTIPERVRLAMRLYDRELSNKYFTGNEILTAHWGDQVTNSNGIMQKPSDALITELQSKVDQLAIDRLDVLSQDK